MRRTSLLLSLAAAAFAGAVPHADGATTRVFSSYLGGPGGEFWVGTRVAGAAIAPDGTLIVAGDTASVPFGTGVRDLRTAGGGGARDVFVARVSADGATLLRVAFLGGNGRDDGATLAVRSDGTVVVAGRTLSTNLTTTAGAPRSTPAGDTDVFVAVLNPALDAITYLTYLGGIGEDEPSAVALDAGGNIVLSGTTRSSDFPTLGSAVQGGPGGNKDAFVTRIDRSTGQIALSTYVGGSADDTGASVGVAAGGEIVTVGATHSPDFPVVSTTAPTRRGAADVFFVALDPTTGARLLSTYFGGTGTGSLETANDLAIGSDGAVRIVGTTDTADFPVSTTVQPNPGGGVIDGFLAVATWAPGTLSLQTVTYLGGGGNDAAYAVAVDAHGTTWVTGGTQSDNFPPTSGAFDTSRESSQDAFVVAFNPSASQIVGASYFGGNGFDVGLAIAVDPQGDGYVFGQTDSTSLETGSANGGAAFDPSFNDQQDAFVLRVSIDADHDGLPDAWETQTGLSPSDATGDNGAAGDPDADQLTNLQEYTTGGAPLEATRYFAEGATGTTLSFSTRFAVLNPHASATTVTFDFLTGTHQQYQHALPLGPGERATVDVGSLPNLPALANAEFSTVVRSTYSVVADRTMTWNATGYGSTAETGAASPARTWYLAEGATHSSFDLFYLIENPGETPAQVRITFLRPAPKPPLQKTYTIEARSRFNVWVNQERFPDDTGTRELASEELSGLVEVLNGPEIIVERAMYHTRAGKPLFDAGHNSLGVTAPATSWFLAEGATGDFFDLYVLIANPSTQNAVVEATYLLEDGTTVVKTYDVAPQSRRTVWVDGEDPALANAAVSTIMKSTNGVGIIVERAMWWPGPSFGTWTEAHNSPGVTQTGTAWALAEGQSGGPGDWETYVLIANTSAYAGAARVTLHYEGQPAETESIEIPLGASSRRTVAVNWEPGFTKQRNRRYGVVVEALATNGGDVPQIVVERAMYSSDSGHTFQSDFAPTMPYWSAGTNAVATRLR